MGNLKNEDIYIIKFFVNFKDEIHINFLFDHVHNVGIENHAKFHGSSMICTKVMGHNVVKNVTSVTLFV